MRLFYLMEIMMAKQTVGLDHQLLRVLLLHTTMLQGNPWQLSVCTSEQE